MKKTRTDWGKGLACLLIMILGVVTPANRVKADYESETFERLFSITPYDEEWKQLKNSGEMIEASQVSEDVLASMETDELIEAILYNPFLTQFFFSERIVSVMHNHLVAFNIYRELYQRDDVAEVLVDIYLGEELRFDYNDFRVSNRIPYLEIMAMDQLLQLEGQEIREDVGSPWEKFFNHYLKLSRDRNIENQDGIKYQDGVSYYCSDLGVSQKEWLYDQLSAIESEVIDQVEMLTAPANTEIIYLPNGQPLTAYVFDEFDQDMINLKDLEIALTYPLAYQLSSASRRYNCHSYAWYLADSSTNHWWINDPSPFYPFHIPYVAVQFSRVRYLSGLHSAILVNYIPNDLAGCSFVSKWGAYGTYIHEAWYGPEVAYGFSQGLIFYH